MKYLFYHNYPVGNIGIAEEDGKISGVFFQSSEGFPKEKTKHGITETPLIKKAAAQLEEYFSGRRKKFDLPLLLRGTDFQMSVWSALQKIPYGSTRSYKEIAAAAGNPGACRAAGMANNRNPIVIIIPCHRVIGANGSLTGYGGGLEKKQYLLDLEEAHID